MIGTGDADRAMPAAGPVAVQIGLAARTTSRGSSGLRTALLTLYAVAIAAAWLVTLRVGGRRRAPWARTVVALGAMGSVMGIGAPSAFAAAGDLDPTFGPVYESLFTDIPQVMVVAPGGGVVVASRDSYAGQTWVIRMTTAGDLDEAFGPAGANRATFDPSGATALRPTGIGVQADGRIVVVGQIEARTSADAPASGVGLIRFLPNGALDATFDGDGRVTVARPADALSVTAGQVKVGSRGRIAVAFTERTASGDRVLVSAFGIGGKPDRTFGLLGRAQVLAPHATTTGPAQLALLANGRVLTGAADCNSSTSCTFVVVKLTGAGLADQTYGVASKAALSPGGVAGGAAGHAGRRRPACGHARGGLDVRRAGPPAPRRHACAHVWDGRGPAAPQPRPRRGAGCRAPGRRPDRAGVAGRLLQHRERLRGGVRAGAAAAVERNARHDLRRLGRAPRIDLDGAGVRRHLRPQRAGLRQ